jgi:phosphate:Na+ symporter
MTLSKPDARRVGRMFKVSSDIERIGDHANNIAEYTIIIRDNNLQFPDESINELKTLGNLTINQTAKAISAYEYRKKSELPLIKTLEDEIDQLSKDYVKNHISRLKDEKCEPQSGVIFTDMIIDLERSADHAKNIALSITKRKKLKKRSGV